jgi:hypothetical protein
MIANLSNFWTTEIHYENRPFFFKNHNVRYRVGYLFVTGSFVTSPYVLDQ